MTEAIDARDTREADRSLRAYYVAAGVIVPAEARREKPDDRPCLRLDAAGCAAVNVRVPRRLRGNFMKAA